MPVVPVTYWSFRFMIGLGMAAATGAGLVLWLTRRGRAPTGRWFRALLVALPLGALAGNSFGWIFTEMGRQPWVVFGLMPTDHAVSPGVSATEATLSLVALTTLYAFLAVVEVRLLCSAIGKGAAPYEEPPDPSRPASDDDQLTFAY